MKRPRHRRHRRELEDQLPDGWRIEDAPTAKGHLRLVKVGKPFVVVGSKHGDWRARRNAVAEARRIDRQNR